MSVARSSGVALVSNVQPAAVFTSGELAIAYQVHGSGEHDLVFNGGTASNVTEYTEPSSRAAFAAGAAAVGPSIEGQFPFANGFSTMGTGWLGAYFVLSGSPVAGSGSTSPGAPFSASAGRSASRAASARAFRRGSTCRSTRRSCSGWSRAR